MSLRAVFTLCLLFVSLQQATSVSAQAVDGPSTEATHALLDDAISAYQQGDLELARTRFEELHRREPSARTLRGLGIVAYAQTRFIDAIVLFEQSLDNPVRPLSEELRANVVQLLEAARAQVFRLSLATVPAEAQVLLDGAPGTRAADGSFLLSPGSHVLELSAAGFAPTRLVVAAAASARNHLELTLTQVPAQPLPSATLPVAEQADPAQAQAVPAPSAPETRPDVRRMRLRRLGFASAGVGLSALVAGIVATTLGMERIGSIERQCRESETGRCSRAAVREAEDEKRIKLLSALSIGGFVLGGLGAAGAGVSFWAASRMPRDASARIDLGATVRF